MTFEPKVPAIELEKDISGLALRLAPSVSPHDGNKKATYFFCLLACLFFIQIPTLWPETENDIYCVQKFNFHAQKAPLGGKEL